VLGVITVMSPVLFCAEDSAIFQNSDRLYPPGFLVLKISEFGLSV
jgi:hypothetical protein